MISHELRGLTTAVDLSNKLVSLQELIKMCAEQVFASPALPPEIMYDRVALLLNAYLDEAPELQTDLKLTLDQMHRDIDRVSEFQEVRNGSR